MARKELALAMAEETIIGNTLTTDNLGGMQGSRGTALVVSGGPHHEDLTCHAYRPDLIVESITELCGPPPPNLIGAQTFNSAD